MRAPSMLRRRALQTCVIGVMILLALWFFCGLVEVRYVTVRAGFAAMACIKGGVINFYEWQQPLPHPQDQELPQDDDTGLSFHRGPWLIEFIEDSQPERSPFDAFAFGKPNSHSQFSLFPPVVILLVFSFILARPPRPPPPGHCAHCGYDLTGNTSGVCSECGENVPPIQTAA